MATRASISVVPAWAAVLPGAGINRLAGFGLHFMGWRQDLGRSGFWLRQEALKRQFRTRSVGGKTAHRFARAAAWSPARHLHLSMRHAQTKAADQAGPQHILPPAKVVGHQAAAVLPPPLEHSFGSACVGPGFDLAI
jgi:hypothetical protein